MLDLVDSRIKRGVHTSVLDFRRRLQEPSLFDQNRVFGTFDEEGTLRSFIVVQPMNNWCYLIIFMIARRLPITKYKNAHGYNAITQTMIEYMVRQMEQDGFYISYVARPTNGNWIRTEENPDRTIRDEYLTMVLETVPADTEPKSAIGKLLLRRLHDEPMEIVMRRRFKGREDVQPD